METAYYNPSKLEIDFAKAIVLLKKQLEQNLHGTEILDVQAEYSSDNPFIVIKTRDADGDLHELVMQVIQRPDSLVK